MWWLVIPAVVLWFLGYKSRGFRIFTILLAIAAFFLWLPAKALFATTGSSDSSIVRNYALAYDVSADGQMTLVETLDVEFTETKRGIFRFFDESDGVDETVRHPVTVESVKRCPEAGTTGKCVSEPFDVYYEDGYLVAKIGSANRPYPAGTQNRYVITSSTTGAITQPTGNPQAQWYWNVVAPGWNMPIDEASVRVRFPKAPTDVRCITESGRCDTKSSGEQARLVSGTYRNLPPRTPVTWQADLPTAGLTVIPVDPGQASWWRSPAVLGAGALLAAGLIALIALHRERRPESAPVFAAPTNDLLPAVWTYREEAPDAPFQAMLLQLHQLGLIAVEVDPQGQMTKKKPEWVKVSRSSAPLPAGIAGADDFVTTMDLTSPGSVATIEKKSVSVGKKVQATEAALTSECETSAAAAGYFRRSNTGFLTHLFAAACPVLALVCILLFDQRWLGAMFLVPAVAGLWSSRSLRTRLTDSGLAMRDQVSGLRTALATPASVERFDYSLRARYFAQFLPWAVALDCADEWAEACRPPEVPEGSAGYDPTYAAAWSTYSISEAVSTAVASVSAGAVAAYAATQSSSSSGGGGGFSSGGGSGGGGGGSW